MSESVKIYIITVAGIIGFILAVAVPVTVTVYSIKQNQNIVEMVSHGVDPMAASCAVQANIERITTCTLYISAAR